MYPYGILGDLNNWLTSSGALAKILFALFLPYAVFKFGVSLLKSSMNMFRGKEGNTQRKRVRALVEKKLNKVKNEGAASGTDGGKTRRPF